MCVMRIDEGNVVCAKIWKPYPKTFIKFWSRLTQRRFICEVRPTKLMLNIKKGNIQNIPATTGKDISQMPDLFYKVWYPRLAALKHWKTNLFKDNPIKSRIWIN